MTRTRTPQRLFEIVGAVLLLTAWALPVAASSAYPAALQDAAGSPCPPPCTVCHLTTNGGSGTAVKPFAESMIDVGLEGDNEDLVAPAVKALQGSGVDGGASGVDGGASGVDSDGDGVSDIAELAAGRDPNIVGAGELCGPTYGCGARIEPSGRIDWQALVLALSVIAVLVTGFRKRARRGLD